MARRYSLEELESFARRLGELVHVEGYAPPGKHVTNGEINATTALCREMGLKDGSVRCHVRKMRKMGLDKWWGEDSALNASARRGDLGFSPVLPGYEIHSTTERTDADGNVTQRSVRQRRAPGEDFDLPEGHAIKGVSALVDSEGRIINQWVKTSRDPTPDDIVKAIRSAFDEFEWTPLHVPEPQDVSPELLTIYPIADMHFGLRAKRDEAGEDFDLKIAGAVFTESSDKLFLQSPQSETALVAVLGDWTHHDDDKAITPQSGHTLQVSDDIFTTVRYSVGLAVRHIHRALERHRRVIVKVVKGNHDLSIWIGLVVALEQHFASNDRVTVDVSLSDYWFYRWGVTLVGLHHGHRLKPEQMAGAMATECREDWGETLYRLFLHGHLHHRRAIEVLGVSVECMRTLAAVDQYHSGKYGSQRSLVSITLHKDHGEQGRSQVNLPPVMKRAAA